MRVFWSKKGKYFYCNLTVFAMLWIATVPMFRHYSGKPLVWGYSWQYLVMLALYVVPLIVFAVMIVRWESKENKKMFQWVLVAGVLFEIFGFVFPRVRPYAQVGLIRHPRPYVMFTGKSNAVIEDAGVPMGEINTADRTIAFNALGFRGEAPAAKKQPGEIRVFMLGGSTVFNGNPLSQSIAGHIERLARTAGYTRVAVFNWGLPSYMSGQELSLLLHLVTDYEPDIVIVYDGCNDIYSPYNWDPRPNYPLNFVVLEEGIARAENRSSLFTTMRSLMYRSKAMRFLYDHTSSDLLVPIGAARREAGYLSKEWTREIVDHYIKNIQKMCGLAKGFDFKLAVFLQPLIYFKSPLVGKEQAFVTGGPFEGYVHEQYEAIRGRLKELQMSYASSKGVFIADMSHIFEQNDQEVFWDFVHVTNHGNAIIAKEIYRHLDAHHFWETK